LGERQIDDGQCHIHGKPGQQLQIMTGGFAQTKSDLKTGIAFS
jgi:hypothetical protein